MVILPRARRSTGSSYASFLLDVTIDVPLIITEDNIEHPPDSDEFND